MGVKDFSYAPMSKESAYNNNDSKVNKSTISNGQQVIAENKPPLRTQSVTHNNSRSSRLSLHPSNIDDNEPSEMLHERDHLNKLDQLIS